MSSPDEDRERRSLGARLRLLAKLALPKGMVNEILRYRKFEPVERPQYIKVRVANALGFSSLRSRRAPPTARSFLFVCFGNIMRSPMCEALMQRALANSHVNVQVTSAGLSATQGRAAHPWAIDAARNFGIDLSHHRARPLTPEMLDQADAIFAMDYQNQVGLLCRYPAIRDKVFMLSAYAGEQYRSIEIQDPFYGDEDETRQCYGVLQTCVDNLVATLVSGANLELRGAATASI